MKRMFLIIDPEVDFSSESIPINWNKLPQEVIDDIPYWYFENVYSIRKDGSISEKTVVYVEPTDNLDEDYDLIYEINDNLIFGIRLE